MAHDHVENEIRNYNRNTVRYERLKDTQVAKQSYLNYEREKDLPDDGETGSEWAATVKKLHYALGQLTCRQREVLLMIAVEGLKEYKVASRLKISQSAVSQCYKSAKSKMRKLIGN